LGLAHDRDEVPVLREYGDDEADPETATTLRMHVGGPSGDIHRHIALDIDYPIPR
jgi:hypothetical protein